MNMDLNALAEKQLELSKGISLKDEFPKDIKTIGGFDLAFSGGRVFCAGVVLKYPDLEIIEIKTLCSKEEFPYIPGFLSFREAPAIIRTYRMLKNKPDIILVDGQGICHPRSFGIASSVGIMLNKPSIGVAKSKLCGEFKEPRDVMKPEKIFLFGKHVGWVVKTRKECKPIFISPGHKVSVESSLGIVLSCIKDHKLPEPLRMAHAEATTVKKHAENSIGRDFER